MGTNSEQDEDTPFFSDDRKPFRFSEQDAVAIMQLVLGQAEKTSNNQQQQPNKQILLLSPTLHAYMTLSGLKEQFVNHIDKVGGRCRTDKAALALGVSELHLGQALVDEKDSNNTNDTSNSDEPQTVLHPLQMSGADHEVASEYVTETYLDRAVQHIQEKLERSDTGFVFVSETIHSLPLATAGSNESPTLWLGMLDARLKDQGIQVRERSNGSRVFLSASTFTAFCVEVSETFAPLYQKISLTAFCEEHSWDPSWVKEALLKPQTGDKDSPLLLGEIQGNEFYIPAKYKEQQHQTIVEAYRFHGFVETQKLCAEADMSQTQLIRQIQLEFGDDALVLENQVAVVSRERIVAPWMALVEDAETSTSWSELILPMELLAACGGNEIVLREQLLEPSAISVLGEDKSGAFGVSKEGNVLYLSSFVLENLFKVHLGSTISFFVAETAPTLVPSDTKTSINTAEILEDDANSIIPPASTFVQMIEKLFPAIEEEDTIQPALLDICERVFVENDEVQQKCKQAMRKELEKLQRQRAGGAVHESEAGGAKDQNLNDNEVDEIVVSFEDPLCFAAACYRLQSYIKFYDYAVKHEMESADQLEKEILVGVCADFTRRIHQQCLSSHPDVPPFTFFFRNATDPNQRLPVYNSVIDIAATSFGPPVEVTCSPDPETDKDRDPIVLLSHLLPGGVGQALSHQYQLCASSSGTLSSYLTHVEEDTLTICGLPFKKLDKKSEKKYLATRRQELQERLERAAKPSQVLELTIMILFQSVKNQCVSGSLLAGPILSLLIAERKIPGPVGECLAQLAMHLQEGNGVPNSLLVESVRGCGLCKEISKHTISP